MKHGLQLYRYLIFIQLRVSVDLKKKNPPTNTERCQKSSLIYSLLWKLFPTQFFEKLLVKLPFSAHTDFG